MRIGPDEVRHIANLAELEVKDADLQRLADEMGRIVTMAEQLVSLEGDENEHPLVIGPQSLKLRGDLVAPIPMHHAVTEIAPEMVDGLFVVPKLGGLAEE